MHFQICVTDYAIRVADYTICDTDRSVRDTDLLIDAVSNKFMSSSSGVFF